MNFNYVVFHVSKDFKPIRLYDGDERMKTLRIYQYAKRHLFEGESVFLTVYTTTAMDKMKPPVTLNYYRPRDTCDKKLWRAIQKW